MATEAWALQGVTKRFGTQTALEDITLQLPAGSFVLLAGENGAGKSTLLRLLAGLSRPSEGQVLIGGQSPQRAAGARARIGLLSHHSLLYEDLTAAENLRFCARLYNLQEAAQRVEQGLEEVGLGAQRDQRVGSFSRGMKQRLSLARALLHRPEVLLLDEPYTGLDSHAAAALSRRLADLATTTVMVTHQVEEAAGLISHVALLKRGRLSYHQPWQDGNGPQLRALYERHVAARA